LPRDPWAAQLDIMFVWATACLGCADLLTVAYQFSAERLAEAAGLSSEVGSDDGDDGGPGRPE
jgi:hypothetical protein